MTLLLSTKIRIRDWGTLSLNSESLIWSFHCIVKKLFLEPEEGAFSRPISRALVVLVVSVFAVVLVGTVELPEVDEKLAFMGFFLARIEITMNN